MMNIDRLTSRLFCALLASAVLLSPERLAAQAQSDVSVVFTPRLLDSAENTEAIEFLSEPLDPLPDPLLPDPPAVEDEGDLTVTIERYQAEVDRLIGEGGAYNADLTESLLALGQAQFRLGNHEEALGLMEQAFHISRIHSGLFSSEQIPIINSLTRTLVELGRYSEAHDRQDYLYYLRYKTNPDSTENRFSALLDLAGWSLGIANLAYRQDFAETQQFQFQRLVEASAYYQHASSYIKDHSYADPRIPDLERDRIVANYQMARLISMLGNFDIPELSADSRTTTPMMTDHDAIIDVSSGLGFGSGSTTSTLSYYRSLAYSEGIDALEKRINWFEENGSASDIIRARVHLADWNLLFQRRNTALDAYTEALQLWETAGMAEAERLALYDELFFPAMPTPIPDMRSPRTGYTGDMSGYHGYIDLAFNLTRYGTTNRIQVMGSSEGTDQRMPRNLQSRINRSVYRPRFLEGEPVHNDTFNLRYYYTYVYRPELAVEAAAPVETRP